MHHTGTLKTWRRRIGFVAFSLFSLATTSADELEFARGGRVRLASKTVGDRVLIEAPTGDLEFAQTDFRSIHAEPWLEREWDARVAARRTASALEQSDLARWALGQGMVRQAVDLWRDVHAADPACEPARRIVEFCDRLAPDWPSPDLKPVQTLLNQPFQAAQSAHIVLLHQHTQAEAGARLDHLETILTGFYLDFLINGIELRLPNERLIFVWFARGDDYRLYLRDDDATPFLNTHGYYHPTRRLVFTYDSRDDDAQAAKRAALIRQADELAAGMRRIEKAPGGARVAITRLDGSKRTGTPEEARQSLDAFRRDLQRQRLLLDMDWLSIDLPIAAHELIHQLVAASGLAPRFDDFPAWLHEGLAMQYESLRGGHWAGLDNPSVLRLRDWNNLKTESTLAALLRGEGLGRGYRQESYARAWSFVDYLRTEEPAVWLRLLDALRTPGATSDDAALIAREALLSQGNDDLLRWEKAWQAHRKARPAP